jgi:hypothetical protein
VALPKAGPAETVGAVASLLGPYVERLVADAANNLGVATGAGVAVGG